MAIKALHELNQQAENNHFSKAHLVVAGGYDKRLAENREHFQEISKLINDLGMTKEVLHLLSKLVLRASPQLASAVLRSWATVHV